MKWTGNLGLTFAPRTCHTLAFENAPRASPRSILLASKSAWYSSRWLRSDSGSEEAEIGGHGSLTQRKQKSTVESGPGSRRHSCKIYGKV